MTGSEKHDAYEQKLSMYNKAHGRCEVCGKRVTFAESQCAHRIPKTKNYLEMYGPDIIHHPFNLAITCEKCNQKVLIKPATQPVKASELLHKIYNDLKRRK
jgi:5-methylcytosine-specific restriction endonuclease McrA